MSITIKTNGHPRELKYYAQLPEEERADFDYMLPECTPGCHQGSHDETCQRYDAMYDARFFNYRGSWYDSKEFDMAGGMLEPGCEIAQNWDAWQPESAFSAVLLRWYIDPSNVEPDYDTVVIGYAHW